MTAPVLHDFARLMVPVALEVLGEPNKALSNRVELRWGSRGSLSVNRAKGTWCDHENGDEGGGVLDLLKVKMGLEKLQALQWLRDQKYLPQTEANGRAKIAAVYDYTDAGGELLFQVCRYDPKDFRQRRPDGDGWLWKMAGVQRVLYRLPKVIAAVAAGHTIFVAEGEKAVAAIEALGLVGTCSPAGAGKWRTEYCASLRGGDVVVLPDNDEPGRMHASQVVGCLRGVAKRLRVLPLPGLGEKGDVADWVAAGGTATKLEALALAADEPLPEDRVRGEQPPPASSEAGYGGDGWEAYSRAKPAGNGSHFPPEPPPARDEADYGGSRLPPPKAKPAADPRDLDGFDLTEDGIALAFAAKHRVALRYCHHNGAWFQWNGSIWRREETKIAFNWARQVCREIARDAGKAKATLSRASTAGAVERFAQADRAFAVTSEIWDTDPWLLGTPNGTVDLRTGILRPAMATDYITKTTAVTPGKSTACPVWLAFIRQATGGDEDYAGFTQRWYGYGLTGITREHSLMFLFGPGGNGKSVLLNTVSGIMGDYACTAAMDTFISSLADRHPTDLAMLRGARLVTATETEEGRAWAESRIKQLTGGDRISARFMRQDFFTFTPQFKLTIAGNHKPVLRNVDEANRRRFNIAPFLHIPPQPDRELETKLQAEWPGILAWMIEGCLDWQKNGLLRPKVVVDATVDYFDAQDLLAQWLGERCEIKATGEAASAALYRDWSTWTKAKGEEPGTNKAFSATLELRHPKKKTSTGAIFLGLRLLPNDTGVW